MKMKRVHGHVAYSLDQPAMFTNKLNQSTPEQKLRWKQFMGPSSISQALLAILRIWCNLVKSRDPTAGRGLPYHQPRSCEVQLYRNNLCRILKMKTPHRRCCCSTVPNLCRIRGCYQVKCWAPFHWIEPLKWFQEDLFLSKLTECS